MRCTQTACPFCGSMLNFGEAIATGTIVSCLICNRPFAVKSASISEVVPPPAVAADPAAMIVSPALPAPLLPARATAEPMPAAATLALAEVALPVAARTPTAVSAADPAASRPVSPDVFPLSTSPPQRAPAFGTRALVGAGLAFAGAAMILLGGLSVLLLVVFPGQRQLPAGADVSAAPASIAKAAPGAKDAAPIKLAGAKPAGGPVDVADLEKPAALPDPLTLAEVRKNGGDANPVPVPTMPIVIKANAAGVDQQRIDAAIAKGVAYLKKSQGADGCWSGRGQGHPVGYAALGGLTLLECKVSPDDPSVKKAAHFVRTHVAHLTTTYELSLAILFLDRLGSPKDKIMIQGLALRLLAGQNTGGGWTYNCPMLSPPDMQKLLTYLKSHRPALPALPRAIVPPAELAKQAGEPGMAPRQTKGQSDDPFRQLAELMNLPRTVQDNAQVPRGTQEPAGSLPRAGNGDPQGTKPEGPKPDGKKPAAGAPAGAPQGPDAGKDRRPDGNGKKADKPKKVAPINPNTLPRQLQNLPVVALSALKGKATIQRGNGDNSNTQFALLALWAARRHDVPTEHTLVFGKQRFMLSQKPDGGWGYHVDHPTKDTMTCVGLLGLAFGHGAVPNARADNAKRADPQIQQGLGTLGRFIGTPAPDPDARPPMQNLYFLWSVERVAMLYDLKTIGGKDWYGWGAQTLLPNQAADGHWLGGHYPGSAKHTDTCFALLFLRRSNLVPDLTQHLRLQMVIRDPDAK